MQNAQNHEAISGLHKGEKQYTSFQALYGFKSLFSHLIGYHSNLAKLLENTTFEYE